jgi:hypothetical protein
VLDTAMRGDCLSAFEVMAQSTKLGTSLMGQRGVAALSEDADVRAAASARVRELLWLAGLNFNEDGNLRFAGPGYEGSAQEGAAWAAAFAVGDGEVPATRRWFVARGLPALPPDGYRVPKGF